jgi:hypothetical protein
MQCCYCYNFAVFTKHYALNRIYLRIFETSYGFICVA